MSNPTGDALNSATSSPVVSPELERIAREAQASISFLIQPLLRDYKSTPSEEIGQIIRSALSNPEPLGITSEKGSLANAETLTPSTNVVNTDTGLASRELRGPLERPDSAGWWLCIDDLKPHLFPRLKWIGWWVNDWMEKHQRVDGEFWTYASSGNWFQLPLAALSQRVPSPKSTHEPQPVAGVIPKSESLEPRGEPQPTEGKINRKKGDEPCPEVLKPDVSNAAPTSDPKSAAHIGGEPQLVDGRNQKWRLVLTEHNFVINTGGPPIWFERHGNQHREQLEATIAAHNASVASTTGEAGLNPNVELLKKCKQLITCMEIRSWPPGHQLKKDVITEIDAILSAQNVVTDGPSPEQQP